MLRKGRERKEIKLPILDLDLLSKKGIVLNLQLKSCILALGTCFQPKIVCLRLFLFFVCFIGLKKKG